MDYKNLQYKISTGCDRGLCKKACGRQDRQLNTYDWLADVPGGGAVQEHPQRVLP